MPPQPPTRALLTPTGDLDASSSDGVRLEVEAALTDPLVSDVVLDLVGLRFVDSVGLGTLISLRARALELGTPLLLRRPPSQLLRLMSITQTYTTFTWG